MHFPIPLTFIKFCIVGASGTVVNLAILYLLTDLAQLHYMVSAFFAWLLAVINNYVWNTLWTFRQNRGIRGFIRFAPAMAITTLLYFGMLYLFTSIIGIFYIISAVIAIGVNTVLNFVISRYWVWEDATQDKAQRERTST